MNFQDFLTYLSAEKRFSSHTVTAYRNDLSQFSDYLNIIYETSDEKEVTFPMIRSYIVELMEKGYEAKSVNRKLSTIKSYFKYLRRTNQIETNPATKIQSVKTPKRLVKTVASDDLNELLVSDEYFEVDLKGVRSRAIIELLYATGIRRSELIDLKLANVDFANRTIKVTGKRNKTRLIPFANSLVTPLKKYLELQPRNPTSPALFFLTDKGNKTYPKLVYETVKHYLSYVTTVDKKSPHILRHSYATHLLNQGADVNDIKELLGHANLSATQIYTHNSIEKLKTEYNQAHPRERKNQ